MIKKAFFGWSSPVLEYDTASTRLPAVTRIDQPAWIVVFADGSCSSQNEFALGVGAAVRAGEKLHPFSGRDTQVVSPINGTIAGLTPVVSATGHPQTAIRIDAGPSSSTSDDDPARIQTGHGRDAWDLLAHLPGAPPLHKLRESDPPVQHIVITGADPDVMVLTNRYVLQKELADLAFGIDYLKKSSGIDRVTIVTPGEMMQSHGHLGADVVNVRTQYPSAFPVLILRNVFGQPVLEGKTVEQYGYVFFSAEAVAGMGAALRTGRLPMEKKITVIDKSSRRHLVTAMIGTPISKIFDTLRIPVEEKDRIVSGGPMTGVALYDEHHPVEADMDALMVQSGADFSSVSDYPCINCGECVRACPARIPVNMLIRFLEFGDYATAVDEYNLNACIECGLCSYVCVSRIPVFQYIMLAKNELAKKQAAEAVNE